ncbi:MAG: four helix bundle protein [Anaerolineales bacterium]|nr:four helix bundle protein [Anaerolineales bacterium]
MTKLNHAKSFRDLFVYQKAKKVSRAIFEISKGFPKEEIYSLTDQIRRASRSIGAQIAEAWAKRRYERHFISKLTDADAEQMETQHWLSEACDCHYIDPKQMGELTEELLQIGRMLNSMMEKARLFCGQSRNLICEETVEYLADTDD